MIHTVSQHRQRLIVSAVLNKSSKTQVVSLSSKSQSRFLDLLCYCLHKCFFGLFFFYQAQLRSLIITQRLLKLKSLKSTCKRTNPSISPSSPGLLAKREVAIFSPYSHKKFNIFYFESVLLADQQRVGGCCCV